jgi:type I restriction enzyme, S subunit
MSNQDAAIWRKVRLGDLLREVDIRVRDLPSEGEEEPEILSLTKSWGLIPQSERFNNRVATDDLSNYKVVKPGWIVYNPYVIWEGAVHALRRNVKGVVSPVYPIFERIQDDGGFLDFVLRTKTLIASYNRLCSGAVNRRRSIKKEDFLSIEVLMPSLSEQRAIAHILRTVQKAKEATEKVLAATRQLKQSLLQYLFAYGSVSLSNVNSLETADSPLGYIRRSWKMVSLQQLIKDGPQNGIYKHQSYYGNGTPIIRIDDFPNDGGIIEAAANLVNLTDKERNCYGLIHNDILVNRVNSLSHLGKTGLVGNISETMVFESNMMRFSIDESVALPEFVFRFLCTHSSRQALRHKAKRAVAQSSVNQEDVKALSVPLPNISEQRVIVSHISVLDAKIAAEDNRKSSIDFLLESLLHCLILGQMRLPEFAAGSAK